MAEAGDHPYLHGAEGHDRPIEVQRQVIEEMAQAVGDNRGRWALLGRACKQSKEGERMHAMRVGTGAERSQ